VPTRVAFDVTPLLGQTTGVGVVAKGLFGELVNQPDIDLSAFAMSARGHGDLGLLLPPGMKRNRFIMPAGLLMKSWSKRSWPPLELWLGRNDVVHGTNYVVPPTKAAALVTVHDLTALRFPRLCEPHSLRYPDLVKAAVKRGAHVHVLSNFIADEVKELLQVDAELIHVIPAGLERGLAEHAEQPDKRYVLALGTVEPRKNYPGLVRAFDAIAAKHRDTQLFVAGARGWDFEAFQHAIRVAKNHKQIRYLGRVNDLERKSLLKHAAVLAYPSIYEGFGLPPLEAMQAGVPVVASNAGALPEVLGDAALLVNANDDSAFADALNSVLSDSSVAGRLIAAGSERATRFSWQAAGSRFVDLYKTLAK
jgi:glycosyltransferase involved in cell wall biosynthesis